MEMHPNQIKAINEKIAAQRWTAFVLLLENVPQIISKLYLLPSDWNQREIPFDKPLERDCALCIVMIADDVPTATYALRGVTGATAVHVARPKYM